MATWLKQSTSVDVPIGPFLDETDGKTAETALTITQPDVRLKKNNGNWAQKAAAQTLTHEENGWYEVTLDATDTNTLGILVVAIHESGALPVWREFLVVPANVWDSYLGADALQVHANEITAGLITATAIADNAVTAAKIASDAITAAKLHADVTTELQSGLATAAALDTVDNFLDTEVAAILAAVDTEVGAIKTKTDNLPADTATVLDTIDNFLDTEVAAILTAVDTEVAAILVDTNELQTDWTDGGRLDLLIDAILEDTGTTLQAEVDGIQADTEDIQARLPAALTAGGFMKSDILAINGSTAAAIRLALAAANMLPGTVDDSAFPPTSTEFEADDITEATEDHFKGRIIVFTSGAMQYQAMAITAYEKVGANGHFTGVLTEAPANNVTFLII